MDMWIRQRKDGWLMERWKKNEKPSCIPAPVNQFKGDPAQAFWFFDREMIEATLAYQSRYYDMKPQLVSVSQNGKTVSQQNTHLQVHPAFMPQEDGITFQLTPVFLDTVPGESPRLSNWTDLPVGASIGHAGKSPVLQMITGPAVLVDSVTFRIQWNRGTLWTDKKSDIVFSITHPGDKEYKPAVQQAQITIPVKNREGQPQHIEFATLPDIKRGTKYVSLSAVSSCGLPVDFYVESGPAYVDGNRLILTAIPPKAAYPVKVTVIAWQYGKNSYPKIKTAEPVKQTFYIR